MERFPVKREEGIPLCFGVSFRKDDALCDRCPVRLRCAGTTAPWEDRLSLAQAAHRELSRLQIDPQCGIEDLYAELYHRHYGVRPSKKLLYSKAAKSTFRKVVSRLREFDIPPLLYLTAQFVRFGEKSCHRLLPNHLFGPKATARYNSFLRRISRQKVRPDTDALRAGTYLGDVLVELAKDEHRIGRWYVAKRICGEEVDFDEVVARMRPGKYWTELMHNVESDPYRSLQELGLTYGVPFINTARRYIRIQAVARVADERYALLAQRVGFNGEIIQWEAFAEFLLSRFGVKRRPAPFTGDVPGVVWGTHV